MGIDIEAEGLSEFSQELLDLATKDFPKDTKNFLQRAGNKLKANAKNNYKSGTTQGTKNLIKGLKRDRAYKYGKDEWQVRVKNTAPHAWLVEHGHVMLGHSAQGKPKLIVCDEITSALDVSVQKQILELLKKLQKDLALSYLFIGHDLAVVQNISQKIVVMYMGEIVEELNSIDLKTKAKHPYTNLLLNSVFEVNKV